MILISIRVEKIWCPKWVKTKSQRKESEQRCHDQINLLTSWWLWWSGPAGWMRGFEFATVLIVMEVCSGNRPSAIDYTLLLVSSKQDPNAIKCYHETKGGKYQNCWKDDGFETCFTKFDHSKETSFFWQNEENNSF